MLLITLIFNMLYCCEIAFDEQNTNKTIVYKLQTPSLALTIRKNNIEIYDCSQKDSCQIIGQKLQEYLTVVKKNSNKSFAMDNGTEFKSSCFICNLDNNYVIDCRRKIFCQFSVFSVASMTLKTLTLDCQNLFIKTKDNKLSITPYNHCIKEIIFDNAQNNWPFSFCLTGKLDFSANNSENIFAVHGAQTIAVTF